MLRRYTIWSMATVLACCSGARAQYGNAASTQPAQALAVIEGDWLNISQLVAQPVFETRTAERQVTVYVDKTQLATRTRQVDGREVQVQVEETVKVPVSQTQTYMYCVTRLSTALQHHSFERDAQTQEYVRNSDQLAVKFFEIDGEPVDISELPTRLQRPTLVLLTQNGKMAESRIAEMFKPGTLVVAIPTPSMYPSAAPQPFPVTPQPVPAAPAPPQQSAAAAGDGRTEIQFTSFQQPIAVAANSLFPNATPPQFAYAQVVGDRLRLRSVEARTLEHTGYRCSPNDAEAQGDAGSKEVCRPVKLEHVIYTHDIWLSPMADVVGATADGRPQSKTALASALARESLVLASLDGKRVNAFWLQNLKPDALVLTPPSQHQPSTPAEGGQHGSAPAPQAPAPTPAPAFVP